MSIYTTLRATTYFRILLIRAGFPYDRTIGVRPGPRRYPSLVSWYNKSYTQRVKTAISIPDSLFYIAESLAKRMGMSRSELFRHALENYIEAHRHDRVREVLDAIYAEESSDIDEALAEMQWASLSKEDW